MTKQDLQKVEDGELVLDQNASESERIMGMMQSAIASGADPAAMERMYDLYERVMARKAESEYTEAMSRFQAECPPIIKRREVRNRNGQVMYRYAPLEDIAVQVRELEHACGFSHSFNTKPMDGGGIEVTCTVRHKAGHSESNAVPVPATQGQNTNAAQNAGVMIQYGQRYSFIGAFGLTTADEDTDGRQQDFKPITTAQFEELQNLIDRAEADVPALCKYLGCESIKELPAQDFQRAKSALHRKIADIEKADADS